MYNFISFSIDDPFPLIIQTLVIYIFIKYFEVIWKMLLLFIYRNYYRKRMLIIFEIIAEVSNSKKPNKNEKLEILLGIIKDYA